MDPAESARTMRRRIFFVVTNIISFICLAWTLYGLNLKELRRDVAHLDWRWVVAGIVLDVLLYAMQAWRWILVLKPVAPIPVWECLRAIWVGVFVNEFIPLRAGEIIRCYLLALWTELPVSVTLASAVIERIFDGIWLVACLFLAAKIVHLQPQFVAGGYLLAGFLLVIALLVGVAMFWKQQTLDYVLGAKWLNWVHILIEDLHRIGHSRYLYYAALVSFLYILMQALPIYALIRSYSKLESVTVFGAFALMVILRLAVVIPQAPGNVGIYNGITVVGLQMLGVALPVAKRFSIILFAAITVPLLIVGFVAVAVTGVKMGDLHKDAKAHMKKREPAPEPVP